MNLPFLDLSFGAGQYSIYLALFLVLLLGWSFLPISEELILVTGGYLAYAGYTNFYATAVTCLLGSVGGDIILYSMGRLWGPSIIRWRIFTPLLPHRRQLKARRYFARYGNKALFVVRFFSGFRMALFLVAGTLKMRALNFMVIDFVAAIINLSIIMGLAYHFGEEIERVLLFFGKFERITILLVVLIVASFIIYLVRRRRPVMPE